jgi:hypothetical protein
MARRTRHGATPAPAQSPTPGPTAPTNPHHRSSPPTPVDLVAELHLVSTMRGLSPDVLLLLEFGLDDDVTVLPLTLHQAHQLHTALDKLLTTAAA